MHAGKKVRSSKKSACFLWLDRLARWGVSLFFLVAAVPKLLNVSAFAAVIDAYGILPEPFLLPIAVVLPVVEIVLAVGLMWNLTLSKIGIAALLLVFIVILANAIRLGLDIDCGCFGPEDPESQAFHGLRTALVRDVAMLIPLAYSFWYHRYRFIHFQFRGDSEQ